MPDETAFRTRIRLKGLDGLRAVSILAVIALHLSYHPWIVHHCYFLKAILNRGGVGVLVFFVISGFLITWLLLSEEQTTGKIDLKSFYIRRSLRILPPAFFFLIVIRLLAYTGWSNASWWEVIKSGLFLRDYAQDGSTDTAHFWSLAVEEQFYFFWPLCLVLVRNAKARIGIVLLLIVGVVAWRFTACVLMPGRLPFQEFRLDTVGNQIMTGCLLALLAQTAKGGAIQRFFESKLAACIGAGLFLASLTRIMWQTPTGTAIGTQICTTGVAMMLYFLISGHDTFFDRIMNAGIVVWIGRLSYSLYLWQMPFCYTAQGTDLSRSFPVNVIISFAMATFSFYLLERPSLRLRDRIMGRKARSIRIPPPMIEEVKTAGSV